MADRLAVIVPTRGRPENIRKVIEAWDFTGAWADADLILAIDLDDPELPGYRDLVKPLGQVWSYTVGEWMPMVSKLNLVAVEWAQKSDYSAIAFAGDDHLPRTIGWARRYLDVLAELGTGMVYGDDGYQGAKLSTEWAVTADAVRALGRMVPAPVDHLYCDNAMMDLFGGAGALRHLPEIRIEHMHPVAGKAKADAQYDRVNSRQQYAGDRKAYEAWKAGPLFHRGLDEQIHTIRNLRWGRPDEPHPTIPKPARQQRSATVSRGSGPRKIERSGPSKYSAPPKSKYPFPREFRYVIGATPDEIAFTLADYAKNVPADQEIVELGVYQGRTALIMAWGAAQGHGAHVTGVDLWDSSGNTYDPPFTDPATREAAFANVTNLGYQERVTLVQGSATEEAGSWKEKTWGGRIGLLFVDDDHSYEGARAAIEAWAPHLADGAVIAVDDYGHPDWPGVAEAVDDLVEEGVLAPIEVLHDRLAVTKLAGPSGWQAPGADPLSDTIAAMDEIRDREQPITAITSEGVAPEPITEPEPEALNDIHPLDALSVDELRDLARKHEVPYAGVMGEVKLRSALRERGVRP